MENLSDNTVENRSLALLVALNKRTMRDGIPMVIVILAIGGLAKNYPNTPLLIFWIVIGLSVQAIRYYALPRLSRPDANGALKRLRYATLLALMSGLCQTCSIVFFPYLSDGGRFIYTVIIFSVCTGHIVGSHGYLPTFLAFAVPQLLSVAIAWIYFPISGITLWQHANVLLIGVLGVFLYLSSRDVFRAFEDHCVLTEKLQTALESETNANAAKTRFLASASHDLRQPLHTMSMLSAALTLQTLDDESASIANRIKEAMAELSAELDSLLDISKMDAGATRIKITRFRVQPLIERLINDYQPAANGKKLKLLGIYKSDSLIETDRALLERTIRNLLDNAIKYTEEGSISVNISDFDSTCVIQVEDTGVGIPEKEQKRVYEEFYQLHNPERDRQNGLGLGLSIVGRIVRLLDADLKLTSTPGIGSTFTLNLPCIVPSETPNSNPVIEALPKKSTHSSKQKFIDVHVLICEDNRAVRQSMRTLLESSGCRVSEAASTSQARQIAMQDAPDILLLDVRLPDGDSGYITVAELRKVLPDVPAIMLSGELISEDAEFSDVANCEYFVKPVEMNTLFKQMRRML
ncbi:MAG: hybrid sensor histidine kinase/response regulator [Granulosicoccus sp.]